MMAMQILRKTFAFPDFITHFLYHLYLISSKRDAVLLSDHLKNVHPWDSNDTYDSVAHRHAAEISMLWMQMFLYPRMEIGY